MSKQKLPSDFTAWAKTLDWGKVCNVSQSLDDLNDGQFRFIKGRFIELLIEHLSLGTLKFVGEKHRDFTSDTFNCSVELKSEISNSLYTKKGMLRKTFSVRLNNSMGTNKITLDANTVADWLIIVKKDGAVLVNQDTVIKHAKSHGDGFSLNLTPETVTELSGKITAKKTYELNLKDKIDALLRSSIIQVSSD